MILKDSNSIDRVIQVDDTSIGNHIRQLRQRAGLKQTDTVARLQIMGVDISVYSYNRIEKGTQNPTVSCLLALCSLFHCDMNDIFGLSKESG